MEKITITTQAEFDALPDKFDEFTRIYITAWEIISVRRVRENSSVVAWGNSCLEAWGNSSVEAQGHSSVVARENSSVEAQGHSFVVAWGHSSVVARENSSVKACGHSSVKAWENSSVVACENSSVKAWGHSSVKAWENSSVVACENSSVQFFSGKASGIAKHNAIFIITECDPKIETQDDSQIVRRGIWRYDIRSFCDCYKSQVSGDFITLYKTVREENRKDFHSNTILYEGTVECPDFDPNPNRECGGGLHLSPTPQLALSYNKGLVLECRVAIEDIVIFPKNISKVRCRKVEVVGEKKLD